jgi:superfamily I DNA/RNA helicase
MLSENDDWEKIRMNKNYRSTKQICEYANEYSHYAKDSYRIPLESDRNGVDVNEIEDSDFHFDRRFPITEKCIDSIVEELKSEDMDTAILCRTNGEVTYLQEQLKDYGISTHSNKKKDFVFGVLKSAIDEEYFVNWLSVCLNSQAYSNYLLLSAAEEEITSKWFIKNFGKYPQVSKFANQVFDVRRLITSAESVDELNEKISDMFGLDTDIFDDCENKYEAIVDAIKTLDDAEVSGIYCGTVHSVKGLEFDRVIVINAGNPTFGLLGKGEENKNIFYVAVTRAKQKLIVFRGYVK